MDSFSTQSIINKQNLGKKITNYLRLRATITRNFPSLEEAEELTWPTMAGHQR
jgi:hypothetical protein